MIPLFLYTSATALGISSAISSVYTLKIIVVSVIYLLFLFHLRVLDEFKDYAYDTKFHTDRPVQKGLISLSELKLVGLVNLLITFILAFLNGPFSVSFPLVIAYLYTVLMFKEFFEGRWLKKQIVLYLISHELVFLPLFWYFFSAIRGHFWRIDSISSAALLVYFILPVLVIEIGRKIPHRYDKKGRKTDDTYSFTWGEPNTIRVFASIIIVSGLLSMVILRFNFLATMAIIASGIFLSLMSFRHSKIIVQHSMSITTFFALGLPLCLLI